MCIYHVWIGFRETILGNHDYFDEKPACCPGVVSHNQIMMMITFPYESMPNRIDNQLKPPSGDLEMPAVSGGSLDQKKQKIDLGILIPSRNLT